MMKFLILVKIVLNTMGHLPLYWSIKLAEVEMWMHKDMVAAGWPKAHR
jgi:hypothetical protein